MPLPRLREMYRRISVLAQMLVFVLVAALGVAPHARAQVPVAHGIVEGTALDSASGLPMLAVIVILDGTKFAMLTDAAGRFMFREVPVGSYTLRARQARAKTVDVLIQVVAGQTTTVTLHMVRATTTLAAVTANAKSPERDRFELSPNIGAISLTKNASKHVPQFGEPDVLRVVQLLPGVNARNDFSSGFNVRGGESDQNLILLDGYPIYNPFHLGGLFSTFLEETVGSIDLLTGGFGARYGGRLSSILDVTSSEPDKPGLHGASNISVIASSLTLGMASDDGRSSWTASGRRTYADKFIAAISDNEFPYHFSDAQFHGVKALGKGELKLRLSAYSGADFLDGNFLTTGDSAQNGSSTGGFIFGWTNQLIGTTLSNMWRDSVRVPLFGVADSVGFEQHVSLTRFATELDLGGGALSLSNSIHDLRIAGAFHWHRGTHERRLGYEASGYSIRYDVLSSATPTPLFQLAQHPTATAGYYQETWKPAKNWITEAGVRVEHITGRNWSAIQPRLSLKYFVNRDLALSAAVGDYSQALHSLNREDIPIRIFDFWVAADQYTPVSTARHYVLGLERWIGPLRFMRVEGWVKKYNNLLEQNTADDPAFRGDEFLVSKGVSYGFDVLLRQLEIGPVGGWLAYTYGVSSRARNGSSYWPGHDRRHNLNLVASYKPEASRYTFSARLGVSSGTPYTDIVGQIVRRSYNPRTHLFDDDRNKEVDAIGGAHNGSRYPLFQRVDLGVSRTGDWRGMTFSPYLSVVNALNTNNVFIYTFDYQVNPPTRNTISQFPFLPSLGLTIGF